MNNQNEDKIPDNMFTEPELIFKYSVISGSYTFTEKMLEVGIIDKENLFRIFKLICDTPQIGSYLLNAETYKNLFRIFGVELILSDKSVTNVIANSICNILGKVYEPDEKFIDYMICFLVDMGANINNIYNTKLPPYLIRKKIESNEIIADMIFLIDYINVHSQLTHRIKNKVSRSNTELEAYLSKYAELESESKIDFIFYLAEHISEFHIKDIIPKETISKLHWWVNSFYSNFYTDSTREENEKINKILDIIMSYTANNYDSGDLVGLICDQIIYHQIGFDSKSDIMLIVNINKYIFRERKNLYSLVKIIFEKNQNQRINKLDSMMIMVSFFLSGLRKDYVDEYLFSFVIYDPEIIPFMKYLDEDMPYYCNLFVDCVNNVPKDNLTNYFPRMKNWYNKFNKILKKNIFCLLCKELSQDILILNEKYSSIEDIPSDMIMSKYIYASPQTGDNAKQKGLIEEYCDNNPDLCSNEFVQFFGSKIVDKNTDSYFLRKIIKKDKINLLKFLYYSNMTNIESIINSMQENTMQEYYIGPATISIKSALDILEIVGDAAYGNNDFMNRILYDVINPFIISNDDETEEIDHIINILTDMGLVIRANNMIFYSLPTKYIINILNNTDPDTKSQLGLNYIMNRLNNLHTHKHYESTDNIISLLFRDMDSSHMEFIINLVCEISKSFSIKYQDLLKREFDSYARNLSDKDIEVLKMKFALEIDRGNRQDGFQFISENSTILDGILSDYRYTGLLYLGLVLSVDYTTIHKFITQNVLDKIKILRQKYDSDEFLQRTFNDRMYLIKIQNSIECIQYGNNLEKMFEISERIMSFIGD